ncbi:hypothetical protein [Acetoanaerobium sticklandii]|uniref:hypothetical protein n=1 Tax=Acetoanaerobium sticklandii TaxID=1511 RepID=UPI003A8D7AD5
MENRKDTNKRKTKNFFKNEWRNQKNLDFNFFNSKSRGICNRNCPVIFFDIISLFARDCDYKLKECHVDAKRLFITGINKKDKNELMLRYAGDRNELIVARICFIEQRQGKMTELYTILKRIQKKYKTGKIIIESVMTEGMEQWCIKYGFVKMDDGSSYIEK